MNRRSYARKYFLVALLVCSTSMVGFAQGTWTWTTEEIAPQGMFTSIAADNAGNVHVTYSAPNQELRYAYKPVTGSKWFDMQLARGGNYSQVRVDHHGFPHVCYTFRRDIFYAGFNGKDWNIQQVAPGSGTGSYSCSVAVEDNGTPHMTWYHEQLPDFHNYLHFKHAVRIDGTWYVNTVDMCSQTGKWNFLALDAEGHPHVSYDCFIAGQQRYASYDGKKWTIAVVEGREHAKAYNVGLGSSVYIQPDGTALIAYYTLSHGVGSKEVLQPAELKFARQNGDTWDIQTVDDIESSTSWMSFKSYIVEDQQGYPHISYEDSGNLKHAYWDGKKWNIQVIAKGGSTNPFRFNAMAIDGKNRIYLSYRGSDGSVMVATGQFAEATPAANRAENTTAKPQ